MSSTLRIGARILLGVVVLLPSARADDARPTGEINLRPSFVEGRALSYALEQKTVTSLGQLKQVVAMNTKQLLRTRKVDEKKALIDLQYTACSMVLANPDGSLSYDSENPQARGTSPVLKTLIGAFLGKTLSIEASPHAEIRKIGGVEEIRKSPQGAALAEFFREDVLKRNFAQLFRPSPGHDSVSPGERWVKRQESPFDETSMLVVSMKMKLESVSGDKVIIGMRGDASFAPRRKGGRVPYKLKKQSILGRIEWDQKRRVLLSHQLTQHLEIEQRQADGSSLVMGVHQETRTRLVEKKGD